MTTNFNIGDTVRLTGKLWDEVPYTRAGDIVTIAGVNPDAGAYFTNSAGLNYYIYGEYEAELVEDRQGENGEYVPVDEHLFTPIKQDEKIAIKAPEATKPSPLPDDSLKFTLEITDHDGATRKYGFLAEGLTEGNYFEVGLELHDVIDNTLRYHFEGPDLLAEEETA